MVNMEQNNWWYKGRKEITGKLAAPFLASKINVLDAGCSARSTMEYM